MSRTCESIIVGIKTLQKKMANAEAKGLLGHLRIGEMLVVLKDEAPTKSKWAEYRNEVGYDQRTADRYLQLGRSWWINGGLEAAGFLHRVPRDLLILELLCQLSRDQLGTFLDGYGLEGGRSQVIERLKRLLGKHPRSKPAATLSAAAALERIDR